MTVAFLQSHPNPPPPLKYSTIRCSSSLSSRQNDLYELVLSQGWKYMNYIYSPSSDATIIFIRGVSVSPLVRLSVPSLTESSFSRFWVIGTSLEAEPWNLDKKRYSASRILWSCIRPCFGYRKSRFNCPLHVTYSKLKTFRTTSGLCQDLSL